MKLSANWLSGELFGGLNLSQNAHYYVAYSGGVDSTVLLHLMRELQRDHSFSLTALHVNHNLQPDSLKWEAHCKRVCLDLGIEFKSIAVKLQNSSELMARKARYHWFSKQVKYGDVLLTAHHRQDRAETLLFNLMRGAGSTGLSSLRAKRPFLGATLARPLLNASHTSISAYANEMNLSWVEDPSNASTEYSRNAIRHNVIPSMQELRVDAVQNIARAAANLEEENGLLREIAISDLVEVREQPNHPVDKSHALCVEDMAHLSPARQTNLIRFWLQSLRLHTPSRRFVASLLNAIAHPPSSTAVLQEGGKQFRFYRGFMYVMPAEVTAQGVGVLDWANISQPIDIFQSRWRLDSTLKLRELASSKRGAQVRLVERAHLNNPKALHGHTLNLKKWMQEMAIPPWRRQSLPLLTLQSKRENILLGAVDQQLHNDWVDLEIAS